MSGSICYVLSVWVGLNISNGNDFWQMCGSIYYVLSVWGGWSFLPFDKNGRTYNVKLHHPSNNCSLLPINSAVTTLVIFVSHNLEVLSVSFRYQLVSIRICSFNIVI